MATPMKFRLLVLLVILGLMLITAGCGPTKRSAPIRDYSPAPQVTTEAKKSKTSTSPTAVKSKKKTTQREVKIRHGEYRVKPGDTLYSISMQFGVDHNDLARLNKIDDQNVINVGQILQIPRGSNKPSPEVSRVTPKSTGQSSGPVGSWRWPVNGALNYRYMEKVSERGKGIGIKVSKETPVFSAAPGKVVYSGTGLRGYGKLLIVKHNEDFLSVYAHNSQLLTSEGQYIAQGQQIAISGGEGYSDVLHFEVRLKGKPVDPLKYLPKR